MVKLFDAKKEREQRIINIVAKSEAEQKICIDE